MKNNKQSFEEYLLEVAPSGVHTNNSPEGFERWLENLDTQEVMDYAEDYGNKMYLAGFDHAAVTAFPSYHEKI